MAEYYFISQLPSLDGLSEDAPLPITEEDYSELCHRYLGKKVLSEAESLTLLPRLEPESSRSALIEAWNLWERDLRLALASVRAEKMGREFDMGGIKPTEEMFRAAKAASDAQNPLEAERLLTQYRLGFLESLRPTDSFSDEYIYYYGLRLRLISRLRRFDTDLGRAAYKSIYDSVLNGAEDILEATDE